MAVLSGETPAQTLVSASTQVVLDDYPLEEFFSTQRHGLLAFAAAMCVYVLGWLSFHRGWTSNVIELSEQY